METILLLLLFFTNLTLGLLCPKLQFLDDELLNWLQLF